MQIKRDLKGVKVEFEHQGQIRQRRKISGFSSQPPHQLMFELDGGEKISVAQYFKQKYNIVLKYPLLPAIQSGNDARPLKYHESGRESIVDPRVGQWNMINKKMVDAARVEFWTCVNFSRCHDPERFCDELLSMCCSKGMVCLVFSL
nr:eukaryotic translation initiation factor 2C [Ipomoea batatas]